MTISKFQHLITIAVPPDLIDFANDLAVILGNSANDARTFVARDWALIDGPDVGFAVIGNLFSASFLDAAQGGALSSIPAWANAQNLAGANVAKSSLIYDGPARLDRISVRVGMRAPEAIAQMGLAPWGGPQ